MKHLLGYTLALFAGTATAWLPGADKIRGVNLGGLFVSEPWMMNDEWNRMGCGGTSDEFNCVQKLGQAQADINFQKHYDTFITQGDIQRIKSLGLNTIRIPVGYWMREDIVKRDSEHYPKGGFQYLKRICQWAKDAGIYVIIDLHAAPGVQQRQQSFTGHIVDTPGFFTSSQYERAYQFLEWMANIIHTDPAFWMVGTLQVVNEPAANYPSLVSEFYPNAWKRIRAAEAALKTTRENLLHIQMMDQRWGSGDPKQSLTDLWFAFYDNHNYLKWTETLPANRDAYMRHTCNDDISGNWPVVVGEWSLSPRDENNSEFDINRGDAKAWYRRWWSAQTYAFEKQNGWIFWSWKVQNVDWRWGYSNAVDAGVIPTNARGDAGACNGFIN